MIEHGIDVHSPVFGATHFSTCIAIICMIKVYQHDHVGDTADATQQWLLAWSCFVPNVSLPCGAKASSSWEQDHVFVRQGHRGREKGFSDQINVNPRVASRRTTAHTPCHDCVLDFKLFRFLFKYVKYVYSKVHTVCVCVCDSHNIESQDVAFP